MCWLTGKHDVILPILILLILEIKTNNRTKIENQIEWTYLKNLMLIKRIYYVPKRIIGGQNRNSINEG